MFIIVREMVDNLINKLLGKRWLQAFKITTAPRWLILLIDMLIVVISFGLVAVSLRYVTGETSMRANQILVDLAVVVSAYFIVTYATKSYTCVIRLSVIEDLYRELLVVVVSTVGLLLLNLAVAAITDGVLMSYWAIIYTGACAFSLLMIERLMIKYLYARLTAAEGKRKKVLVLGTSLHSLILANALKNEIEGKYDPIGLLTTNPDKTTTTVNGFKIYKFDPDTIEDTCAAAGIEALIFSAFNIAKVRNTLADHFMKAHIALLAINKVEEFDQEDIKADSNISTYVKEVQIEDLLGREPIVLNNTLVRSHIKDNVVLITGACGSIGSEIVRQVAAYKAKKIILVDQAETPMHDLSLEMQAQYPEADIVLFMGDVQNKERMEMAFRLYRPKYVFHAAAYKHVPMMEINPTEAVLTNVDGTRNVADLALKYGVYKFVMVSTDKAVNPSNIMGCSKRLAEIYCQSLFTDAHRRGKSTQFITTRFGNVLGSNGSVIPLFRKQIAAGGPVTVTHHDIIRYFMTIPEACSLVLEAGCMGHGGEIYIFDMGEPVKIYDLAVRMISLAGLRLDKDIKIKEVGLRPGEKLYEELLNDKETTISTDNDKIMIAKVRTYNYNDVRASLGYIIDEARDGNIHDMVLAMKRFVPEFKSMHSEYEAIDKEIEKVIDIKKVHESANPPAPM